MAVTITVGTTSGLNYHQYLGTSTSSFLYGHAANPAYGEFYGSGHTIFGGPQHLIAASAVDTTTSTTEKGVLSSGDFDYTFASHTLDGTLDSVAFGYGPTLNTAGVGGVDSYVTLDTTTELTIDGLDLTTSGAGANTVHSILYGFINGTTAPLTSYLASLTSGVEFNGNAGNDTFTGYGYADRITGGGGADALAGGGGADVFVYAAGDSTLSAYDTISDFDANANDTIDLSGLSLSGGFSSGGAAADSAWLQVIGGVSNIFADADGNGSADFRIRLTGLSGTIDAADFAF